MSSPFPGMNPYLENESVWRDFRKTFMALASESLNKQILPRYYVRIAPQYYVHELAKESRHLVGRADLSVTQQPSFRESVSAGPGLLTAPAEVATPDVDIECISYLEIVDRESQTVADSVARSPAGDSDAIARGRCRCPPGSAATPASHLRFGRLWLLHLRQCARASPITH